MATRRPTIETTAPSPAAPAPGVIDWPVAPPPTDDDDPQTAVDRIISMLSEAGDDDGAYVKVSRVKGAGKVEFCNDYAAHEFEAGGLKMVREQWGPGEYQLVLYGTHPGTNRFVIRTRSKVQIAAPLGLASGAGVAPRSDLAELVQQLAANQQQMMTVLTQRPAGADPMQQMKDTLALMAMFREAMGPAVPAKNSLSEAMDIVRALRDVSAEISPPPPAEGPMAMVEKMLPLFQAAMAARAATPPAVAPPRAAVPDPAPTAAAPAALPNDQGVPDVNMITMLEVKGHIATLVKMAGENGPIEAAAQLVYDKLPDPVIAVLEGDAWFAQFVQIAPEAAPFEPWFQQVRTAALALFESPDDAAP